MRVRRGGNLANPLSPGVENKKQEGDIEVCFRLGIRLVASNVDDRLATYDCQDLPVSRGRGKANLIGTLVLPPPST